MRMAVVHIGMPKTGSTSLQAFFRANTKRLAEQGITYPKRLIYPDGHAELGVIALSRAGALVPDRADRTQIGIETLEDQAKIARTFEAKIDASLPKSDMVLFSSESLSYWLRNAETRAALDAWLLDRFDRVGYVVCVRSEESFILSNYAEAVKRGMDDDLDDYIAHGNFQSTVRALKQWHRQFGPRLVPLELPGRDASRTQVYQDICHVIGANPGFGTGDAAFAVPKERNASPSALQLRAIRGLNRMVGPNHSRSKRLRKITHLLIAGVGRLPFGRRRLALTASQRALIKLRNPQIVSRMVARFQAKAEGLHWSTISVHPTELPGARRAG